MRRSPRAETEGDLTVCPKGGVRDPRRGVLQGRGQRPGPIAVFAARSLTLSRSRASKGVAQEMGIDGVGNAVVPCGIHLENAVGWNGGDDPGQIAVLLGKVAVGRVDHVARLEAARSAAEPE